MLFCDDEVIELSRGKYFLQHYTVDCCIRSLAPALWAELDFLKYQGNGEKNGPERTKDR